jgi:hypothetical protein
MSDALSPPRPSVPTAMTAGEFRTRALLARMQAARAPDILRDAFEKTARNWEQLALEADQG